MSIWLGVPLIMAAFLSAWLVLRLTDRHAARRNAEVAAYFRRQVDELSRMDEPADVDLEYEPRSGVLL